MDPDVAWQRMREAKATIDEIMSMSHFEVFKIRNLEALSEAARSLAEHAEALEEWVRRGGFLPAEVSA